MHYEGHFTMNDTELKYVRRLEEGDSDAFDILFTQYYPQLKRFFLGFVKDEDLAQDMAQDIFFKIWTNRKTISKVDSFNRYLFRMARNIIYDYYDHELVKENYEHREREKTEFLYSDILEEEIYAKELSLLIDLAIEKMPPQRKQIFILSRKKGLTNEEIAKQLEINKRTVENHISLAIRELKKVVQSSLCFFL